MIYIGVFLDESLLNANTIVIIINIVQQYRSDQNTFLDIINNHTRSQCVIFCKIVSFIICTLL